MKRLLLLTTIGVLFCVAFSQGQNVFDPNDPIVRYNSGAALGSPQNPNPNVAGLQKWVSIAANGVSTGSGRFDASSFKAYFINFNGNRIAFRIKFPKTWSANPGKKFPAMLFMHGAGEPGCPSNGGFYENERQLLHGGNLFRQRVDNGEFDGFLIYPQAQAGASCWSDWGTPSGNPPTNGAFEAILAMIDSMYKYVHLDRDRVIVTGLSNGGGAAWHLAAYFPQWVAKTAPSAAATGASNFNDFMQIPIWFSSGGKDNNPNPGFSNAVYNGLKNLGADIQFTLFEDLGHSVWYEHWQLPGFVQWMNDMHKANPLVYFQRNEFCPGETVSARLGISPGYYQYQWERNGEIIATATANSIFPLTDANNPSNRNYVNPKQKYTNYTLSSNSNYVSAFTGNTITLKANGTYRVRFKRKFQDTEWSEWSPKPVVVGEKALTATPPIVINMSDGLHSNVLPAPDGSTTVPLMLPEGYTSYQWFRNNQEVGTGRFFNAIPGVYRAKANEQFGCGSDFSPAFNVISANGEPKPEPATNLMATVENQVNIHLKWTQNPNPGTNETGFEIYRSTGGSGGPYKLIAITDPDVTTYIDQNQPSGKDLYYIVRAIGDYGAAAISNEATVSTPSDLVAPTAPTGVEVVCTLRDKVTLRWSPSSDNVGVAAYDIYINGVKSYTTPNTRYEIYQLTPNTQYAFAVVARDAAGNESAPSAQVNAYTRQKGVCYKVYAGDWDELPDFNTLTPVKEGMSNNIDLSVRPTGLNDYFGFVWEGHIRRTGSTSTHSFQICSDDGSRLYFNTGYNPNSNGTINNDGLHGEQCVTSGNFTINSGDALPFTLVFFEKTGGEVMKFNWRVGTSGSYVAVPNTAFATGSDPSGGVPSTPTGLSANAVSSSRINLSWNDASNNETGFEITRATSAGGPFLPRATVNANVNTFADTGLNASTQYWYRVRAVNFAGASNYSSTASATTQAPPPAPTAPSGLSASSPALQTVLLQWNDNSNNETAFEIWRSVGNDTEFELLATVPGGAGSQKSYEDKPVFANVHYYYRVRAIGSPTPSAFSNTVNVATANSRPKIISVPDFTVRQGSSVSIPISATDPDGDPLQFIVPGLPYFASIQPVSNGNANIVVSPPEGEQGGFTLRCIVDDGFGGRDTARFTIVVNDNSLPVLNPINDVTVNEGDSVVVNLTATDAEMNQYMVWSFQNKPSWVTFTNTGNGTGQLKFKPGYAASGLYNMTVIVDDGFGAWTSRSFNIIVNEVDPNETIQISFKFFTNGPALWNNVQINTGGFNMNNLINKKGQNSGAGIRYLSGGLITASAAGAQAGGLGVFPDNVMLDQLQIGHNQGGRSAQLQVYGLDPKKKYNLVFFASTSQAVINNEGWRNWTPNTSTRYTAAGQTAEVILANNTTNTDTIYQVQPNAAGEITFTMSGEHNSAYVGAILNALVVEAQIDDGTTPAKPTNVQAQVVPNQGVRITWNDVAYNENSYKVYRATDRNGPYTALTPDAARDSVQLLDPNVEPYTQYFYYVRGVNHLGLGESSDTVSATTGNNKPLISGVNNTLYVKAGSSVSDDFNVADDPSDVLTVTVLNKPSFVSLTSLGGGNYRITANPTIDDIGFHYLTIQATDDHGGLATEQISISVSDALTRSVFVNIAQYIPAPAPWNNLIGYGNAGNQLTNLRDETNAVTPFGIQLMDGWDDVNEMGQRTGNNSGVFPDSVLAGGIVDWDPAARRIRFFGLNPAKRYNLVFVGSLMDGRAASTRFYVNASIADTLNPRYNAHSTANLNGITPPANGEVIVNIERLSGNYMALNGVQIEEYDPSVTLMPPSNLYVQLRQNMTSAEIYWSDRANNEYRYEVQRATNENFTGATSTLVAPGSSSLINSGVASGLAANTKYWFRVRAIGPGGNSAWSNKKALITPENQVNINFNFSVDNAPAPWNNTQALPNFVGTWPNLMRQDNSLSGIVLSIEKIFNGEYAYGPRTGNNSGVVPDNALQSSYWIDKGQVATMRLSGLNKSKRYRIGFTGTIDNALFGGRDFTMTYTINGRTVHFNPFMNSTHMVWIGDIEPDMNGEVLIEFSTPVRNSLIYGFTSAMIIQSYNDIQGGTMPNGIVQPTPSADLVSTTQTGEQITTEIAEQAKVETRVYPNPFNDHINLEFNNSSATNQVSVEVYDITGRVVYRRNFGSIPAGATLLRLNVGEGRLNTGVYMVTLKVNGLPVQSTKMIKDRN
jgi:Predicted peptidase